MIRRAYRFTGQVQGVGFRYRARHAAGLFHVTGWVRNRYDGSVAMEVQGERDDIDRMIEWLRNEPFLDIDGIECRDIAIEGNCDTFEIRRG